MHGQYSRTRLMPGENTGEVFVSEWEKSTCIHFSLTELEIFGDDDFVIQSFICKQFEVFAGRWRIRGIGGQLARHLSRSAAAIFAPNSTLLRFSPLVIFPTPQSLCYSTKSYAHCALHRDKIFTAPTMWRSVVIVSLDSAKLKGETSQKL